MPKVRVKLNSTDIVMLNSICNSIKDIAQKIAQIKNIPFDEVAEKTTNNAKHLFNLKHFSIYGKFKKFTETIIQFQTSIN